VTVTVAVVLILNVIPEVIRDGIVIERERMLDLAGMNVDILKINTKVRTPNVKFKRCPYFLVNYTNIKTREVT